MLAVETLSKPRTCLYRVSARSRGAELCDRTDSCRHSSAQRKGPEDVPHECMAVESRVAVCELFPFFQIACSVFPRLRSSFVHFLSC